jgi:hypothetical protein
MATRINQPSETVERALKRTEAAVEETLDEASRLWEQRAKQWSDQLEVGLGEERLDVRYTWYAGPRLPLSADAVKLLIGRATQESEASMQQLNEGGTVSSVAQLREGDLIAHSRGGGGVAYSQVEKVEFLNGEHVARLGKPPGTLPKARVPVLSNRSMAIAGGFISLYHRPLVKGEPAPSVLADRQKLRDAMPEGLSHVKFLKELSAGQNVLVLGVGMLERGAAPLKMRVLEAHGIWVKVAGDNGQGQEIEMTMDQELLDNGIWHMCWAESKLTSYSETRVKSLQELGVGDTIVVRQEGFFARYAVVKSLSFDSQGRLVSASLGKPKDLNKDYFGSRLYENAPVLNRGEVFVCRESSPHAIDNLPEEPSNPAGDVQVGDIITDGETYAEVTGLHFSWVEHKPVPGLPAPAGVRTSWHLFRNGRAKVYAEGFKGEDLSEIERRIAAGAGRDPYGKPAHTCAWGDACPHKAIDAYQADLLRKGQKARADKAAWDKHVATDASVALSTMRESRTREQAEVHARQCRASDLLRAEASEASAYYLEHVRQEPVR